MALVVIAITGTTVGARVVVVVVVVVAVTLGVGSGQRVGGAKRQMTVL